MMGNGWGMGLGMIFMLVFWVALITLIVWAVTRLLPSPRTGASDRWETAETAEQILDRRFAAGEINSDEYRRALGSATLRRPYRPGGRRGDGVRQRLLRRAEHPRR